MSDHGRSPPAESPNQQGDALPARILEHFPDAIVAVDAKQRIIYYAGAAERLFGYPEREILGAPLEILIPHQLRAKHAGYCAALVRASVRSREIGMSTRAHGLHKSGETFPIEATITRLDADDGVQFSVVLRNVSGRSGVEETLDQRERDDNMMQESSQRAARLTSVGTLAAGIAHEINNPLASILAAAQYALADKGRSAPGARVERALHDIVNAARRGGRIVRGVLQITRDEPSEKSPNDLGALLARARQMTAKRAAERRAVVELAVADALPALELNPTEIEQVFVNLIHNAVEAGQEGVHVWLEATHQAHGVRVVVRDDGPGMTAEQQGHVFEPFYTTRQAEGGTGLGLSIVHGIVSDHGGRIEVHSQSGSGASFIVDFPLPGANLSTD